MKEILIVGIGGFVGSILRFKTGEIFLHNLPLARFPWATFTVNITGCFVVGVLAAALARNSSADSMIRLLLITGFCGGFTTFSAFGLETAQLLRSGDFFLAAANVAASVSAGLLAVWCGLRLGEAIS